MTDDPFARYTTPSPSAGLRARVLAAAASARTEPAPLRILDALWSSRAWWLGWTTAMVLLVLLAGVGRSGTQGTFTAESWTRYRASVAQALGGSKVAVSAHAGNNPGGTA